MLAEPIRGPAMHARRQRLKQHFELPMLHPHYRGWPGGEAGALFEARKEYFLFISNMSAQFVSKALQRCAGRRDLALQRRQRLTPEVIELSVLAGKHASQQSLFPRCAHLRLRRAFARTAIKYACRIQV